MPPDYPDQEFVMKKNNIFGILSLVSLLFGYIAVFRLLSAGFPEIADTVSLPAGFPTCTGLQIIWAFLFLLWGISCFFVFSVHLSPRRKRNIFLNTLILILGIFTWNYMVFGAANFSGAIAIAIAILLLALVIWFMYLVTHRYGGYLFTPMMIWSVFILYLSIALTVKN